MFEDWIKEKQTATDHDIEKDFQIPTDTLKRWRLNKDIEKEKKLRDDMKKISQAIEKQMYQEKKSILATSKSLFEKTVQGNERRTKLHIVGKKN